VAISSILSALAGTDNNIPDDAAVSRSAFLYFLFAFLITVVALIGRLTIVKLPFYRNHISIVSECDVEQTIIKNEESSSITSVLRATWGLNLSVAYIFIITLMLFPSITSLIKSVDRKNADNNNRFFDDDIFVAFHFLLYNVGDWIGRIMPLSPYFQIVQTRALMLLSFSRTIFIPLFLLCNIVVSDQRLLPTIINNDIVYFAIVILFSISNGWICSLCMMAAPKLKSIENNADKAMVGGVMSFSLVLGLAIGGSMSFVLRSFV